METKTLKPLSFANPDRFKPDGKGMSVLDEANSEYGIRMEALGRPAVHYLAKANKYYKDTDCKVEYLDTEITALGLKIPAEIENDRRKLIKIANDAGKAVNYAELYAKTGPGTLEPPEHIRSRLVSNDPLERMISRVNRSTVGR